MMHPVWRANTLTFEGATLAYYTAGAGEPLIFVAGGPGDTHTYLRPLAAQFVHHYTCVLYDQRGTGASRCPEPLDEQLTVDALLRDLAHLQQTMGTARVRILGHSWGATLALLYALTQPHRVSHLSLVGLGPLGTAESAVADANMLRPLLEGEQVALRLLSETRAEVTAKDDTEAAWRVHAAMMGWRVRSWFYDPAAGQRFL